MTHECGDRVEHFSQRGQYGTVVRKYWISGGERFSVTWDHTVSGANVTFDDYMAQELIPLEKAATILASRPGWWL